MWFAFVRMCACFIVWESHGNMSLLMSTAEVALLWLKNKDTPKAQKWPRNPPSPNSPPPPPPTHSAGILFVLLSSIFLHKLIFVHDYCLNSLLHSCSYSSQAFFSIAQHTSKKLKVRRKRRRNESQRQNRPRKRCEGKLLRIKRRKSLFWSGAVIKNKSRDIVKAWLHTFLCCFLLVFRQRARNKIQTWAKIRIGNERRWSLGDEGKRGISLHSSWLIHHTISFWRRSNSTFPFYC